MKTTITIKGTHCPACKKLIEAVSLEDIKGIKKCEVDYQTGKTVLEHDENLDWENFKKEIESLGEYHLEPKKIISCLICGLAYADPELAKKCHEWCQANGTCNLEIIARSLKS